MHIGHKTPRVPTGVWSPCPAIEFLKIVKKFLGAGTPLLAIAFIHTINVPTLGDLEIIR
jgi:hypothetical protein